MVFSSAHRFCLAAAMLLIVAFAPPAKSYDLRGECDPHGDCSEPVLVPQRDPTLDQAYLINEQGRAAMRASDYERAESLFAQAYAVYPDPVYQDNRRLAESAVHNQRGNTAYNRQNWRLAIAEYEQAQSIKPSSEAAENLLDARYQQTLAFADAAWKAKRYDQAIFYFNEARKYRNSVEIPELIRMVRHDKAFSQASAAAQAGNFEQAENLYRQALSYDPLDEAAARNVGWAAWERARAISANGSMQEILSAFGHALDAYASVVDIARRSKEYVTDIDLLYRNIGYYLAQQARGPSDWTAAVANMERWYRQSGNHPTAKKVLDGLYQDAAFALATRAQSSGDWNGAAATMQLLYNQSNENPVAKTALAAVKGRKAGNELRTARNAADFNRAAQALDDAARESPGDRQIQKQQAEAHQQKEAADRTNNFMTMTLSNVRALDDLKATSASGSLPCVDGGNGCTTNYRVPTYLPAGQETAEMKQFRATIQYAPERQRDLQNQIAHEPDPFKRLELINRLSQVELEASTAAGGYEDATERLLHPHSGVTPAPR